MEGNTAMAHQYSHTRLASLLGGGLGSLEAEAVIAETATQMGLSAGSLVTKDALDLFDRIAAAPGIAGIAARFAKVQLYLGRPPSEAPEEGGCATTSA